MLLYNVKRKDFENDQGLCNDLFQDHLVQHTLEECQRAHQPKYNARNWMDDNTSLNSQNRPEVICSDKKKKKSSSEMGGKATDRKVGIKRVRIKRE